MTESRSGRRTILQVLLKVVTALFSVALIVLIGALLVLAQPKQEDTEKAEPQPLLTASPAMNITVETDLRSLVESFPVPVLSFMSGSGMSFVSGTSSDAGLEGGFGRVVLLFVYVAFTTGKSHCFPGRAEVCCRGSANAFSRFWPVRAAVCQRDLYGLLHPAEKYRL